jgi:hypothetical protein
MNNHSFSELKIFKIIILKENICGNDFNKNHIRFSEEKGKGRIPCVLAE